VSGVEKSKVSKIEEISLKDLGRINQEAENFMIGLVVIGGYAARAFTQERSWRFTKDIDFITTIKDLTALRGIFELLKYAFEKTDFGVKGSKKINAESIELHISVDKVFDWSTGLEYVLTKDVFAKSTGMPIRPYFEENGKIQVSMKVAPIEDILIMKLMTERTRDHFDAIAMILDSFERLNISRFWINSKQSNLDQHIRKRLISFLADIKKGLTKKIWKEFTGREFIREQEVTLKKRINELLGEQTT
jgi:predicted nucleotidyltransferase component of viral defense system